MRVEMAGMEVMEEMVADVTPKTNNSALKALEMCAALSMSPSVGRSPWPPMMRSAKLRSPVQNLLRSAQLSTRRSAKRPPRLLTSLSAPLPQSVSAPQLKCVSATVVVRRGAFSRQFFSSKLWIKGTPSVSPLRHPQDNNPRPNADLSQSKPAPTNLHSLANKFLSTLKQTTAIKLNPVWGSVSQPPQPRRWPLAQRSPSSPPKMCASRCPSSPAKTYLKPLVTRSLSWSVNKCVLLFIFLPFFQINFWNIFF